MKKPLLDDVLYDYNIVDMGCYWHGKYSKDTICFDNDEKGNGTEPYLFLKFSKYYVHWSKGLKLTKEEKKIRYAYTDFKNMEKFTDAVGDFTHSYFKSFKRVLVRR